MLTSFVAMVFAASGLMVSAADVSAAAPIPKPEQAMTASDEVSAPTCCFKRAYCCLVRRSCCPKTETPTVRSEETVTASDEVSAPTCCFKRAYCCSVERPCCHGASMATAD